MNEQTITIRRENTEQSVAVLQEATERTIKTNREGLSITNGKIDSISVNGVPQEIVDKNVDITVPTATSELINDSGYITAAALDNYATEDYVENYHDGTKQDVINENNKLSVECVDGLAGVATSGDYNDLSNKPDIPTSTSDLINDSNYVSDANYTHTDNNFTTALKDKLDSVEDEAQENVIENIKVNNVALTIEDKTVNISVPTSTSQLVNDSGFITNAVDNLINYYLKSETYTKTEVNSLIGAITTIDIQVVQQLPTTDISTHTIYFVPAETSEENNVYDEFVYVNNSWELIGSTKVDLSNYYTKSEANNLLDDKVDKVTGKGLSTEDFTTAEKTKLSGIEDGAEENVVNTITVNSVAQTPTNKVVNVEVPTKTTDLDNNSGFITNAVNNLVNYYTKKQTGDMLDAIPRFAIEVVDKLPVKDISLTTIYLLKTGTEPPEMFDEYIYVEGKINSWEKLGAPIDLSDYATREWVSNQGFLTSKSLDGYATEQWVSSQGFLTSQSLSNYYTKSEIDAMIGDIESLLAEV